jgi:hypothetical protein
MRGDYVLAGLPHISRSEPIFYMVAPQGTVWQYKHDANDFTPLDLNAWIAGRIESFFLKQQSQAA